MKTNWIFLFLLLLGCAGGPGFEPCTFLPGDLTFVQKKTGTAFTPGMSREEVESILGPGREVKSGYRYSGGLDISYGKDGKAESLMINRGENLDFRHFRKIEIGASRDKVINTFGPCYARKSEEDMVFYFFEPREGRIFGTGEETDPYTDIFYCLFFIFEENTLSGMGIQIVE